MKQHLLTPHKCINCAKKFMAYVRHFRRFCGRKCANNYNDTKFKVGHEQLNTGRTHFKRKSKVGYMGLHLWLRRTYGKANKCEDKECLGKSKTYHWANKSLKYLRKRSDWMQLCQVCHIKYDRKKGWGVANKKFNLHK